jgi:hypothetical protein
MAGTRRFDGALRTVIASAATQSMAQQERKSGLLRCARNDGKMCVRDLAAGFRARFARNVSPLRKEGAGNAGRSMRPQPGGQKNSRTSSTRHHGHTGNTQHSPHNGLQLTS